MVYVVAAFCQNIKWFLSFIVGSRIAYQYTYVWLHPIHQMSISLPLWEASHRASSHSLLG